MISGSVVRTEEKELALRLLAKLRKMPKHDIIDWNLRMCEHLNTLMAERDRLKEQLAEARRDAQRYRKLKALTKSRAVDLYNLIVRNENDLDTAVDALPEPK